MALSLLERSVELKLWLSPDYEPIFRGLAMKALGDNVRKARTGDVSEDLTLTRTYKQKFCHCSSLRIKLHRSHYITVVVTDFLCYAGLEVTMVI